MLPGGIAVVEGDGCAAECLRSQLCTCTAMGANAQPRSRGPHLLRKRANFSERVEHESQRGGSEAAKSLRLFVLPRRSGHALSGRSSHVAVSSAAVIREGTGGC